MSNKFKVGDKVIVVKNTTCGYDEGTVGIITEIDDAGEIGWVYQVETPTQNYTFAHYEVDLELYKEEFKVDTMNGMMGTSYDDIEYFGSTKEPIQPIIINPTTCCNKALGNKESAMRFNTGKPKWSLVNYASLVPMVEVLEFGAHKYEPHNWMKSMDAEEILESMQRHLAALMDGETHDSESYIHHIGHIMCNAMFYSYHNVIKK